jgi:hypothetical protein
MGDRSERFPDGRGSTEAGRFPAKGEWSEKRMMQQSRSVALRQFDEH